MSQSGKAVLMQARLDALRELIANPTGDVNALAIVILIIVLLVLIVALVLIAIALPSRRPSDADTERDRDAELAQGPLPRRRKPLGPAGCAAIGALLLFGFAVSAVVAFDVTSTTTYCSRTCHAMAEPAASWAISAHRKVSCVRCHEGAGRSHILDSLTLRTYSLYLQATGAKPRAMRVPVANCLSCHRSVLSRRFTALNGETFTHEDFAETPCRECHKDQGHIPHGADEAQPTR